MQEQNRYQFLELNNQNIDRWLGLQLAMDQESIIWSHPEVPFTQYMCVDLYLRGQDPISLEAGLDDDSN